MNTCAGDMNADRAVGFPILNNNISADDFETACAAIHTQPRRQTQLMRGVVRCPVRHGLSGGVARQFVTVFSEAESAASSST